MGQGCVKKLLINYLFQKTVSAHHWRGAQGAALRKASQMRRKILIVCPSKNKTTTTTTTTKMTGETPEVRSDKRVLRVLRVLRVNYYQSAFNSQKEKLNILAEMLEISKSCIYM